MTFGMKKTNCVNIRQWKNLEDIFIRFYLKRMNISSTFYRIHSRTWRTDRHKDSQTPHDGIGRAYAKHIARQKLGFSINSIYRFISKTVQDTAIVTMEDQYEDVWSIGAIFKDLERPWVTCKIFSL